MLQLVLVNEKAWTPLQLHSDHPARIVRCRALSVCCVATSLVASPGLSVAWELIPGGGGGGLGATLQRFYLL